MDIAVLYDLKREYERDLLLAEARVSVINDLIARTEQASCESNVEESDTATTAEVDETIPAITY